MKNKPTHQLVLDCSQELAEFKQALFEGIDAPELIDWVEPVELVFDCITQRASSQQNLHTVALHLFESVDNLIESGDQPNNVAQAVYTLGSQLIHKFVELNAYVDDCLPFKFRKILRDDTVVLSHQ